MMPVYVSRDFPEPLRVLPELALDLHWTWSHAGDALWKTVSPATWGRTRNPWAIVQDLSQERLAPLTQDTRFLDELQRLLEAHWHAIRFWTAEHSVTYAKVPRMPREVFYSTPGTKDGCPEALERFSSPSRNQPPAGTHG